jgi:hypothetical protein
MGKQREFFILFSIVMVFILSSCQLSPIFNVVQGSGTLVTENRPISNFNAIKLDGAGRLIINQGDSESLEIRADDNLISNLTAEVQGDTLYLGYREKPWRKTILPSTSVVYTLSIVTLNKLTLNGAADVEIHALETDTFALTINGAGTVSIQDLATGQLNIALAGTGSVSASGFSEEQSIIIDGAGSYQAGGLQTKITSININGLGNGTVWATDSLDVNIVGGGTVNYYGSPNLTQEISGLGEVKNIGEK